MPLSQPNSPFPLSEYPRVLLVTLVKVKDDDTGNLLIRAEFGNWPMDRLAQIHAAGELAGHGEFCGRYYRLQACDRFLGGLFQRLRGGVIGMVEADAIGRQAEAKPAGLPGRWTKAIKKRLGDWLIGSGLWELIFHVRLSKPMAKFVEEFKPDLIYCQGYSMGFATLPLLIARRFNIPICFQTTDDWPSYACRGFFMGRLLRRRTRQLIAAAKVRMAFGEKMQRLYENRYGVPFEATYHLDDPKRFQAISNIDVEQSEVSSPLRIIYTGSLGLRRYEAIQDLLHAIQSIDEGSRPIQIEVYSSGIPKDTPRELIESPRVQFMSLPTHDELPRVLASASILFLPESFNAAPEMIEYSISSKAHLYMMSGRPILVYGPTYSGTVEYAASEGWGLVVAERSSAKLKESLAEMLAGGEWINQLRRNAEACIQRHHDLAAGRKRFCEMLADGVFQTAIQN